MNESTSIHSFLNVSCLDWTSTASAFIAGLSALVSIAAVYYPWRLQNSQELLKQAILSLERAYATLSKNDSEVAPPAPDRLNWLTTARHIERYKNLKSHLTCNAHRTVCEEHEEYWRHRFYVCLEAPNQLSLAYYSRRPDPKPTAGIEPRSALVIHEFASWPDGREDPIDKVDTKAIVKRGEVLKGKYGLRQYLDSLPGYRG